MVCLGNWYFDVQLTDRQAINNKTGQRLDYDPKDLFNSSPETIIRFLPTYFDAQPAHEATPEARKALSIIRDIAQLFGIENYSYACLFKELLKLGETYDYGSSCRTLDKRQGNVKAFQARQELLH